MSSNPAIETMAARQATERPKQTTVVDAHGRQLRVGDDVLIPAKVEALNPEGYGNNVVLRTVREMPAAFSYGPHKSPIHLNGQQCERVEKPGR